MSLENTVQSNGLINIWLTDKKGGRAAESSWSVDGLGPAHFGQEGVWYRRGTTLSTKGGITSQVYAEDKTYG